MGTRGNSQESYQFEDGAMKKIEYGRYPKARKTVGGGQSVDEWIKEVDKSKPAHHDYRDRSLKIHGLICARCGREFDHASRHLLTVHHKDGNHLNNPPDGSNWENLCVYCHEEEHVR